MSYYNYNYNYTSSQSYKSVQRPTILGRMGLLFMVLISICSAVAYVLMLFTPHVEPEGSWISPILGLVAPAIFIVNVLLALYWIIRWRWILATPLIVIISLGVGNISLFAKMPFTKRYGVENYSGTVKVMSFNVRGLVNDKRQRSSKEFASYIAQHQPDIVCIQEYVQCEDFESYMSGYNKSVSNALAIYSRFPVYRHATLLAGSGNITSGGSMWADVIIRDDTIRLFNSHLNSTDIKAADDAFLTSRQLVQDSERSEKVRSILARFKNGSIVRAAQVESISKFIRRSPYSVIVCGDFNDTPISYTYNMMSEDLLDSYQECGDVYPYTYRGFFNTLRIDYILSSKRLKPLSYFADRDCTLSDHIPVVTHLKIEQI